jgi:hypothetical protein
MQDHFRWPTCASKNGGSKLLVRRETTRKVENALF